MISLEHRFIFVHVPKTAGTAIGEVLAPFALPDNRTLWRSIRRRLPLIEAPDTAYLRQHETALNIRRKLSAEVYAEFFSFGVVRNPFDHAISHYEFMKTYRHERFARRVRTMTFAEYLRWRMQPRRLFEKQFVRLPNQSHYLCDEAGKAIVTRVLRHECLAEEWPALARDLNLPALSLPRRRESSRTDRGRPLSELYDDVSVDLVRRLYAPDFRNFGYRPDPD